MLLIGKPSINGSFSMAMLQEVDNVIPPRPFCAFPNVNATFRKSSLSRPFGALPNVNATNT